MKRKGKRERREEGLAGCDLADARPDVEVSADSAGNAGQDKLSASEPAGEPYALGEPTLGEPGLEEPSLEKPAVGEATLGEPMPGDRAVGLEKPAVGEATSGEPELEELALSLNHRSGMPAVRIAVRALAEYACRSGSIHLGFRSTASMQEGTRIHKEVQGEYPEGSQRELFLRTELHCGGVSWTVEGRCDGLLSEEEGLVIDEIKSTAGSLEELEGGHEVHWMQAKGYACMYAQQHGLSSIQVQLTYVQTVSGEIRRFRQSCDMQELQAGMLRMLEAYAPFAVMLHRHRVERDSSLEKLDFPFQGYRPGQRKLSAAVYRTLEEKGGLFAKAPTGIGKTMSVLWPAVRALGTGAVSRVFYLTARTTTRAAAEEALGRMQAQGLRIHAATLTAKEKICPQEQISCRKEDCPFADGYYDRINGALLDLLEQETLLTREVFERYALKHRVCPFEFSLDAAYAADAIICDYNYIYDPKVSLKRLLAEQAKNTALLVDEAHNLPDRARAMYSAELEKAPFLALQRSYKGRSAALSAAAKGVNAAFIALRKEAEGGRENGGSLHPAGQGAYVSDRPPQQLLEAAELFAAQAEQLLASGEGPVAAAEGDAGGGSELLEAYWAAKSFLSAGERMDERFRTMVELSSGKVKARIHCLDPSQLLQQSGKAYGGRVFFSATLSPLPFYMDQLGALEEDRSLTLPSPFRREQLEVRVSALSTRYVDRAATLEPLVRLLLDAVREKGGNWLAFFPSYAYMNAAYERLLQELEDRRPAEPAGLPSPGLRLQLQRADMDEQERDRYLAAYRPPEPGDAPLLGFAVMGGVFSEGVDLAGERLEGVAVIGVGLPQLGPERDLLAAYERQRGRDGFDYAYVYPGISKVLQAGGRLIRSETDTGVLLLIDDRYGQARYRRLLPEEWREE